jgi:hypothetical protein
MNWVSRSCLGSQIQTGNEASPEAMLLCRHHRPSPQIQQFRVIPGEDSSKCATE